MFNKPYVIVDIDGVVVDNTHRLPLITKTDSKGIRIDLQYPNWEAYTAAGVMDTAGPALPLILQLEKSGTDLIFLTARRIEERKQTIRTLKTLGVRSYFILFTRTKLQNDLDASTYKVQTIADIFSMHGSDSCLGMFEDSWKVIKAIQTRYPNLPIFRPHNLVRKEDVTSY